MKNMTTLRDILSRVQTLEEAYTKRSQEEGQTKTLEMEYAQEARNILTSVVPALQEAIFIQEYVLATVQEMGKALAKPPTDLVL